MNEQSLSGEHSEDAGAREANLGGTPRNQLTCAACGKVYARIDHLERHARTRKILAFPDFLSPPALRH